MLNLYPPFLGPSSSGTTEPQPAPASASQLTRALFRSKALVRAGIADGSPDADSFLLDDLLDEVVEELTGTLQAKFGTFSTALVAGRALYCLPNVIFIEGADAVTSGRARVPLTLIDAFTFAGFKNANAYQTVLGAPSYAATQGAGQIALYPAPDAPGTLWVHGTVTTLRGTWADDSDVCPLPDWMHTTVLLGLAFKAADHAGTEKAPSLDRQYFKAKGWVHSELANRTRFHSHRFRDEEDY